MDVRGSSILRRYDGHSVLESTVGEIKFNDDVSGASRQLCLILAIIEQVILAVSNNDLDSAGELCIYVLRFLRAV